MAICWTPFESLKGQNYTVGVFPKTRGHTQRYTIPKSNCEYTSNRYFLRLFARGIVYQRLLSMLQMYILLSVRREYHVYVNYFRVKVIVTTTTLRQSDLKATERRRKKIISTKPWNMPQYVIVHISVDQWYLIVRTINFCSADFTSTASATSNVFLKQLSIHRLPYLYFMCCYQSHQGPKLQKTFHGIHLRLFFFPLEELWLVLIRWSNFAATFISVE